MEKKEKDSLSTLIGSLVSFSNLKNSNTLTLEQLQLFMADAAISLGKISNSLNRQIIQKDREISDLKKQLSQKGTQTANLKKDNEQLKDDNTVNQLEKFIRSIEKAQELCNSMLDKGVKLNLITISGKKIVCGKENRTLGDLFNSNNDKDRKEFYSMYDDFKKLDEIYNPIESFLSKFNKSYINVCYPELSGVSSDYNHLIKGNDEDEIGAISYISDIEDGSPDSACGTQGFYSKIDKFTNNTLSSCKKGLVEYKEKLQKNNVRVENDGKSNYNNFNNKGEKDKKEKEL